MDYLLKPIEKVRAEKAINKAITYKKLLTDQAQTNTIESNAEDHLFIKADRKYYKVYFRDIRFIEGLKDYVVIHTQNQKLFTAMNLKTIHQKIPSLLFMRVSKSYLVNRNYIESFDNHTIYVGAVEIPLGETYRKDFFSSYMGSTASTDE
ncbi:LytR/AlgR family response regulator transcription factor [Ohtaekwangia koreensis]|uniref:LytR/AlgR family response regulator transcription factor n=1 Tax=Ohtaekwangia koreensis TaxID=688867 RepID=UPI001FE906BC|nr:LytTR family DNA-binding domain-containing protein [Ohtaekwangia koreensis]